MKKDKLKKKHAKLYHAVWEALHADDKFVVTSKLSHAELVAYLAAALKDGAAQGGYSLIYFADSAQSGVNAWQVLADAALRALQLPENQDIFARVPGTGLVKFADDVCECTPSVPRTRAAECQPALDDPPHDSEADFQDFMHCYKIQDRLESMCRNAYMVGIADAQTPEM